MATSTIHHPTVPTLGRMSVVYFDSALRLSVDTTLDRTKAGEMVTATVTVNSVRSTSGGRASGIVTALADGASAIVTFSSDAYERLGRILNAGARVIVRGAVTDVGGQRVIDVRNAVAVNV